MGRMDRMERAWLVRMAVLLAAVVVAGLTDDLWVDWFDALAEALGNGSTAAAFVGWLAGYAVIVYGLAVLAVRRRWPDAFRRTWLIGALLLIPFITLQPSKGRQSASLQRDYWYLGSFFDTYGTALATIVAAAAAAGLCIWQGSRGDAEDFERSNRWWDRGARLGTAVLAAGTLGTLIWVFVGF